MVFALFQHGLIADEQIVYVHMATTSEQTLSQHVSKHIQFLLDNSPIYGHLFKSVKIVRAEPGCVVVHLPLERIHLNSKDSLHGSVSATLIDGMSLDWCAECVGSLLIDDAFMGGVSIASYDLRDNTGVSTNITIDYAGGAKAGETLEVEGKADKVGQSLAFTSVTIRKVDAAKGEGKGSLVTVGRHTKFVKTRA